MSIDYDLILAGSPPIEQVAEWAFPATADRPVGAAPLLTADLNDHYGFTATVHAGERRYVDVLSDSDSWIWEPAPFCQIGFSLDEDARRSWAVINVLSVVRQVLAASAEDAALVLNSDILLLTRLDGVITKHQRVDWWENYDGADQVIRG